MLRLHPKSVKSANVWKVKQRLTDSRGLQAKKPGRGPYKMISDLIWHELAHSFVLGVRGLRVASCKYVAQPTDACEGSQLCSRSYRIQGRDPFWHCQAFRGQFGGEERRRDSASRKACDQCSSGASRDSGDGLWCVVCISASGQNISKNKRTATMMASEASTAEAARAVLSTTHRHAPPRAQVSLAQVDGTVSAGRG